MLSTGGSSWAIAVTFEDPTGVYPSPNSSTPTGFMLLTGSSNQFITPGASVLPIAGHQISLNAPSSAGAEVLALQSGIGQWQRGDVRFASPRRDTVSQSDYVGFVPIGGGACRGGFRQPGSKT